MHRTSGRDVPNAPIGHHFHDGTHVTYGVATLDVTLAHRVELETSVFRGREPDERHWNVERPALDSCAVRVTVSPTPHWALQASAADVEQPEQIHSGLDVRKATASVAYHHPTRSGFWSTTAVIGANRWGERTVTVAGIDFVGRARTQVALLLESALRAGRWTAVARIAAAEKDELFDPFDPRHNQAYRVAKLDAGAVLDGVAREAGSFGIGASGSLHALPAALDAVYGDTPLSFRLFARLGAS